MLRTTIVCITLWALTFSYAQHGTGTFPYAKIFSYGMDANVAPVFALLDVEKLKDEDLQFKQDFERRFGGGQDESEHAEAEVTAVNELLSIFRSYWRRSLLDNKNQFEGELAAEVIPFLMQHYPPVRGKKVGRDSLGYYVSRYIKSTGLYTTEEAGFHGRLIDLMIWENEDPQVYEVRLSKTEKQEVRVFFLEDFITLGWMEYATLGHHHPGGWTTDEGLYCVKKSYDVESENFKVSYLAHEGRHFFDKKMWPELKSADLEYRAKLTELSLANTTQVHLIRFFLDNANKDSENGHQIANYCLMRDLSKTLFNVNYETAIEKWNAMSTGKIQKAAKRLLKEHTSSLNSLDTPVQSFINSD